MSMHPPEDITTNPIKEMKGVATLFVGAVHSMATLAHTITRVPGSCGLHHFGLHAFVGWVLFSLYATCMPPAPGWEYVWGAYYALPCLFILHRLASAIQRTRGRQVHSQYVGDSWLNRIFPFLGRDFTRGPLEGLACGLLGFAVAHLSVVLGLAFVAAGVAVFLSHSMLTDRDRRKVQLMTDQALESQALAEQFRAHYRSHS